MSGNEGSSRTPVYEQTGQQSGSTSNFGESSFTRRTVSLAAFAGKSVLLRFRYAYGGGQYYFQSSQGIGWYLDNISLTGVDAVASAGTPASTGSGRFDFTAPASGSALLQVRPGMYGYYGDWSPTLRVAVGDAVTPTVSAIDCLFNWAELSVPQVLTPPTLTRTDIPPYSYRFYPGSGTAVAISSNDSHVYLYNGGHLTDVGTSAEWFSRAGCQQ